MQSDSMVGTVSVEKYMSIGELERFHAYVVAGGATSPWKDHNDGNTWSYTDSSATRHVPIMMNNGSTINVSVTIDNDDVVTTVVEGGPRNTRATMTHRFDDGADGPIQKCRKMIRECAEK